MSGDAPCYKCETRYAGCHSSCVKYMDFVQKRAVELEKIKTAKTVERLNYNSRTYQGHNIRQKMKDQYKGEDR